MLSRFFNCYRSQGDVLVSPVRGNDRLAYTASAMGEEIDQTQVWIGIVGVVPREGCELLSVHQGAYINFLTLASSAAEYRAKVAGALSDYCLELLEFEEVRPFSLSDGSSTEIVSIAEELVQDSDPQHC